MSYIGCGALGATREAMSLFCPHPAFSVDVYHKSRGYSGLHVIARFKPKLLYPFQKGGSCPPSAVNTMTSPLSCLFSCLTHRLLTNPWALQKSVLSLALPHHTVLASYPPSLSRKFSHAWETFAEGLGCGSGGGGQLDQL